MWCSLEIFFFVLRREILLGYDVNTVNILWFDILAFLCLASCHSPWFFKHMKELPLKMFIFSLLSLKLQWTKLSNKNMHIECCLPFRKICNPDGWILNVYLDRIKTNLFWLSARKRRAVLLCWVWEGTQAPLTMLPFVVLVSALLLVSTSTSPIKTPVATCCPPGSFLAIEDWQESRQLPNGLWTDSITLNSMDEFYSFEDRQITPPMWSLNRGASDNIATLSDYRKVSRYGRHNYILGVSCVPDKNSLRPIDGFRGSLYPDPPYFASLQDKLLGLETRSKPLAENQILQSTGSSCANPCWIGWKGERMPSCPGGPHELSTVILGDGEYEIG